MAAKSIALPLARILNRTTSRISLFDVALGEPRVLKGQTVLEAFPLLRNAATEIINLLWAVARPST